MTLQQKYGSSNESIDVTHHPTDFTAASYGKAHPSGKMVSTAVV